MAGGHKPGPEERVGRFSSRAAGDQGFQVRNVDRIGRSETGSEPLAIEGLHPAPCCLVLDRPQAHDQRLDTGNPERPAETEDPFPGANLTNSRVTGREDRPFHAGEIQGGDLLGSQNAVVLP